MNNWKIVCDKVSTTMDLSEMEFEKGVATLILSFLGWNEFRGNIKEQYHIEDHAKGYKPDFALFPAGKEEPGLFVELKETGHKQRSKDVKQIRTYMMLTNCRFCIYFGEKMELFFIQIDGTKRSLKSVLTLEYNPKHPEGNTLLDLINYDTFDENRLIRFCEDRLAADEAADFFTSDEGRKRLYVLMAQDRQLSEGAARLLPSMLSTPIRKEQGVETISDGDTTGTKPGSTDTEKPLEHEDVISDFKAYAEKTVGAGTTRNYLRHLKGNVSSFLTKVIDPQADSVFSISSSAELNDCINTLKGNQEFVAFNKSQRYFLTASLSKYLEYLENKEGIKSKVTPKPQQKKSKSKTRENKVWMISASPKFFDHKACFDEYGKIFWKQHKNFKVGDTGYIYFSKPRQEIVFKFEVTACDLPYSEEMAVDKKFYKKESDFELLKEHNRIFIAKLLEESVSSKLTLNNMLKNGLKAAPLGPLNLSDESFKELLAYIESNF